MRAALMALILAAAPPTSGIHHTPAGVASAKSMLLRTHDIGVAWQTTAPAAKKIGELTCGNASPTVEGAVETGSAASPTFGAEATGPFVTESVFVYSAVSGAQRYWQHAVGKQTLACAAKSVTAASTKDVTFKVIRSSQLPSPAGARSAAYRIVGQAVAQAQNVTVYVDVVLVQRGSAIAEVSFASFQAPFSRGMEQRIVGTAAARL